MIASSAIVGKSLDSLVGTPGKALERAGEIEESQEIEAT
jgi:hypothetical protein